MTDRLETDIDVLDDRLDGGLPAGGLVALTASPASQSELFLYRLAHARRTLYLAARRRAEDVRAALRAAGAPMENAAVRELDTADPDLDRYLSNLPPGSQLVVDPLGPFERRQRPVHGEFLNRLKRRVAATGGVAVLHCLDGRSVPPGRDVTEHVADLVFDLSTERHDGDVENHLTVPKHRGGPTVDDAIRLRLGRDIQVDVSRTIA